MNSPAFDPTSMRILVAEDLANTRRIIERTLRDEGLPITLTQDGAQAWDFYQEHRPELIITDWDMPELDGLELCKRIRALNEGETVQPYILMLTGNTEPEDLAAGFYEGRADDFLKKPFHNIELLARFRVGVSAQTFARELERARRFNEQLALTDSLTGLMNRRALLDMLRVDEDRALRGRQPMAVILGDVDRFKSINDDFGHHTGDRVLRVVADVLRAGVRSGDHVGRWGGEEFLILLPDTDLIQAAEVAERCRALLARQQVAADDGRLLRVSSSFGVAAADGVQRPDVHELVQQADKALYWAKEAGRNRVKVYVASADPERRRTA